MPDPSSAYPTDQFVFFGDSLSDNGNLLNAADGVIDPQVFQDFVDMGGQASDGPVFAEFVSGFLGLELEAQNYAVAGAEAAGSQRLGDFIAEFDPSSDDVIVPDTDPLLDFDMNLGAQIDRFISDNSGADLSTKTAFVLAGGNDYTALDFSGLSLFDFVDVFIQTLTDTVQATIDNALLLSQIGFGEVVISSLPAAGFFPFLGTIPDLFLGVFEAAIDVHNNALADGVAALQDAGFNAIYLDLEAMSDAIINDPTAFGFVVPLNQTLTGGDPALLDSFENDQVAFFDDIHPSTATHAMLGAYTSHALKGQVDVLSGTSNAFVATDDGRMVLALGGNDTVTGGAGDDMLFLGTGQDSATGGAGDDIILAGSGNDTVSGDAGADMVSGGTGDDMVSGGAGDDVLFDGLGSDSYMGDAGNDVFIFFDNAVIGGTTANGDTDTFDGGDGTDALIVVLSQQSAEVIANAQITEAQDALDAFGIVTSSIEQVEFLVGLDDLNALGSFSWFADAELWGLI